jgi:hypothetical protein
MSAGAFGGRGKGVKKGNPNLWEVDPNTWEGGLGPKQFTEALERFPEQSKSEFNRDMPLKNYDKEEGRLTKMYAW